VPFVQTETKTVAYQRRSLSCDVRSSIWADGIKVPSYDRNIKSVHRLCALRMCYGFRTMSDEAAVGAATFWLLRLRRRQQGCTETCERRESQRMTEALKCLCKRPVDL